MRDVVTGFPDKKCRQGKSDDRESDAEIERLRPKAVPRGNPTGRKRARGQRYVARELVHAHRQSALSRTDEVDLHNDRRRPRQALADAEQHVRHEHPIPRRRPHQEERHGHRDEPPRDQQTLAPPAVREPARPVIGEGFGHTKHDDERQHGGARGELELLLADCRQDAALQSDHGADERVDDHEHRELPDVLAKTQSHGRIGCWRSCHVAYRVPMTSMYSANTRVVPSVAPLFRVQSAVRSSCSALLLASLSDPYARLVGP